MIKVDLSVREAMNMVANGCNLDMFEKIVNALETALGVNQLCSVAITGGMNTNNRIACIKVIQAATGWGLKDAKDWTDVIVGCYGSYGQWIDGGKTNYIKLKDHNKAEELLKDLRHLGCEGFLC